MVCKDVSYQIYRDNTVFVINETAHYSVDYTHQPANAYRKCR
jgi:hypothetical protein